jgi:hypothetical protein
MAKDVGGMGPFMIWAPDSIGQNRGRFPARLRRKSRKDYPA